jgi:hypothetical protein
MKPRPRARLAIPTVLAVVALAAGCGHNDPTCEVVAVPDAAVPRYQCRDGRTCSAPDPNQAMVDGGIYQICPGPNGCATLVTSTGQTSINLC